MINQEKTQAELLAELDAARQRVVELETELATQTSEVNQLVHSVIASVDEGVIVYDTELRYRLWNPFMERLTGVPTEEAIGKYALELFPHLKERGIDRLLERALVGETVRSPDTPYTVPQTGKKGWVAGLYSPLYSKEGEIIGVIATIHDVTERRTAEETLREREATYRSLVENSNDSIYIIQDEHFRMVNRRFEEMFKISAEEATSPDFDLTTIIAPHSMPAFEEREQLRESGIMPSSEWEFVARDMEGNEFEVETSIVNVPFEGGNATQGIMRDISERKRAESKAIELLLERGRIRILSDFVRNISHEFRTPLSIINSGLYVLERTVDPDKRESHYEIIQEQVRHIVKLLDVLIMMAQLDSRTNRELMAFNLNEVAASVVNSLEDKIAEKEFNFSLSLYPEATTIYGVPDELHLALVNILDNAVRHTPDKGTIEFRTLVEEDQVVIEIKDTGEGIDERNKSRIFERFFRSDQARSTRGLGLGLTIAKKVIEVHKGTISVNSVVGEGTTFVVHIPGHDPA